MREITELERNALHSLRKQTRRAGAAEARAEEAEARAEKYLAALEMIKRKLEFRRMHNAIELEILNTVSEALK